MAEPQKDLNFNKKHDVRGEKEGTVSCESDSDIDSEEEDELMAEFEKQIAALEGHVCLLAEVAEKLANEGKELQQQNKLSQLIDRLEELMERTQLEAGMESQATVLDDLAWSKGKQLRLETHMIASIAALRPWFFVGWGDHGGNCRGTRHTVPYPTRGTWGSVEHRAAFGFGIGGFFGAWIPHTNCKGQSFHLPTLCHLWS